MLQYSGFLGEQKTFARHEVSHHFREVDKLHGYRAEGNPFMYYIFSMFHPHNECINFWTHFIPCCIITRTLYGFFNSSLSFLDPWALPLQVGGFTAVVMLLCSAGAHLLQHRSPRVHYFCFLTDYAAISVYAFGSTFLHFFYCAHWELFQSLKSFYLVVAAVLSLISTAFNAYTKVYFGPSQLSLRRVIQMTVISFMYIWLIIPIAHRILSCMHESGHCDASIPFHVAHIIAFLFAGFFFGCGFPQRWLSPGSCDFIGHSHQLFHIAIAFSTYLQMKAVFLDYFLLQEMRESTRELPTLQSSFLPLLILLICQATVILAFTWPIERKISCEKRHQDE